MIAKYKSRWKSAKERVEKMGLAGVASGFGIPRDPDQLLSTAFAASDNMDSEECRDDGLVYAFRAGACAVLEQQEIERTIDRNTAQ